MNSFSHYLTTSNKQEADIPITPTSVLTYLSMSEELKQVHKQNCQYHMKWRDIII